MPLVASNRLVGGHGGIGIPGTFNGRLKMKLSGDFGRREKMETKGRECGASVHQNTDCLDRLGWLIPLTS